jgi:hypothetical protein
MIKSFVDWIVHRVWGHVVQIFEEVETSSNALEIGHADDRVFHLCDHLELPVVPQIWREL